MDKNQTYILNSILKMIIPASTDGKMPCATTVGFCEYLSYTNITSWIIDGLKKIENESLLLFNCKYKKLKYSEQKRVIETMRIKFKPFFNDLTTHVINCYYQHDSVLKNIGIDHPSPFPAGYLLEEWDINLLEPVFNRGKIYRDGQKRDLAL